MPPFLPTTSLVRKLSLHARRGWWTRPASTGTWARCWPGQRCRRTEWMSGRRPVCSRSSSCRSPLQYEWRSPAWRKCPPTEPWTTTERWWLSRPPGCSPSTRHDDVYTQLRLKTVQFQKLKKTYRRASRAKACHLIYAITYLPGTTRDR